ncbi:unnamed protein product [Heligmosomoides polygyrus]|uniref:Uncharacterized protein n=1 Tax=Heligmosomoides polygyrus TaxID=6339 RepID=A0A183FMT0_HELPZ|nr:unnamed protein product [Heligmosomoides polygyrus]
MSFSLAKVVCTLLAEFVVPDNNDTPIREEKKIARRSAAILPDGAAASVDVETDENLGSDVPTDDESDWDHCDDEGEEDSSTVNASQFATRFSYFLKYSWHKADYIDDQPGDGWLRRVGERRVGDGWLRRVGGRRFGDGWLRLVGERRVGDGWLR